MHLAELEEVDILPEQGGFSGRPAAVPANSRRDPTRRTFVITLSVDGHPRAVGVGVLQKRTGPSEVWPSAEPYVVLRGFSVDAGLQGRGIGTAAMAQSVRLAGRLFPGVTALVLTGHVDNRAGIRVCQRNGFQRIGIEVTAKAGREYVMARRFAPTVARSG